MKDSGRLSWHCDCAQYFIAARHVGGSTGTEFRVQRRDLYDTHIGRLEDDLRIWKVDGGVSGICAADATNNEIGKALMVIGRGTQRGRTGDADDGSQLLYHERR